MEDAAEGEIPKLVRPEKKPRLDGDAPWHPQTQVVAVAKVLDDDNLLREIIVRVGFPTTLVRAALVCKRWLVPMMPQPPELAAVMRRLESYDFGAHKIMRCWNGSVFTKRGKPTRWTHGVHRPLCAEKGMQVVPPRPPAQNHNRKKFSAIVSGEQGSGFSYLYLSEESTGEAGKSMARVYMLQDGVWCICTSAICLHSLHLGPKALLIDNKIYVPTARGDEIIVLDLTASSISTIQLPQGMKYHYFKSMLSRGDASSSVYLIHAEEFQLCVWLHKGGNWLLVDTICLHEMFDTLGISDHTANVQIDKV